MPLTVESTVLLTFPSISSLSSYLIMDHHNIHVNQLYLNMNTHDYYYDYNYNCEREKNTINIIIIIITIIIIAKTVIVHNGKIQL